MFKKKKNEIYNIIWWLNMTGIILGLSGAILIFYSIGKLPGATANSAYGGITAGMHIAYLKSPQASWWGFLLLLLSFAIQFFTQILSKTKLK